MTPTASMARATFTTSDVVDLLGVPEAQASEWLSNNAKAIESRMVEAGWDAIDALIALDKP